MTIRPVDAVVAGLSKDFGVAEELARAVLAEYDVALDEQKVQEFTFITLKALRGEPPASDENKRKGLDRFRRAARTLLSLYDGLHRDARGEIEVVCRGTGLFAPLSQRLGDEHVAQATSGLRELLTSLSQSPVGGLMSGVRKRGRPREWIGQLSVELYKTLRAGGVRDLWTCSKVIGTIMIVARLDTHPGATQAVYDRISRLR